MIPTAWKAKLPKQYCYPIGAQVVSDALQAVPQIDELQLWFLRYPKSTLVMCARYTFPSLGLSTPQLISNARYTSPRWDIDVYAVPREINRSVKTELKRDGLVQLTNWLAEERTETWLEASHRFELHYDPTQETLTIA